MIRRLVGVLALFSLVGQANADSITTDVGSETFRAVFVKTLKEESGLEAELGWLYSEDEGQDEFENLLHLGVQLSGQNWSEGGSYDVVVGARAIFGSPGEYDLGAVAFGGDIRFAPTERIGVSLGGYYAPSVTSISDAEAYSEMVARIDYRILPQAYLFVGYRKIEIETDDDQTVEYDADPHIGLRMQF